MRRNKKRLRKSKYYTVIFSTICGTLLISGLIMFFSYVGSKVDFSSGVISVLESLSISAGGYFSAYLYGKQKRHNGIVNGIKCGGILYIILFLFGIIYLKAFPPLRLIRLLILLVIAGSAGGIVGVNSKIKHPPI